MKLQDILDFLKEAFSRGNPTRMAASDRALYAELLALLTPRPDYQYLDFPQIPNLLILIFNRATPPLIELLKTQLNDDARYLASYRYAVELLSFLHSAHLFTPDILRRVLLLTTSNRIYLYALTRLAQGEKISVDRTVLDIMFNMLTPATSTIAPQEQALAERLGLRVLIPLEERQCELPLLQLLMQNKLLNAKHVNEVYDLDEGRLDYFELLIQRLVNAKMLTSKTFHQALFKVSEVLVLPSPSLVDKQKRINATTNSQLYFTDPAGYTTQLTLEHKPDGAYSFGMYSKVKRGACHSALFAVKIMHTCILPANVDLKAPLLTREARQQFKHMLYRNAAQRWPRNRKLEDAAAEVNLNQRMGRYATFFERNDKVYLITEWYEGRPLYAYTQAELLQIPFENKLHCLLVGLQELVHLHGLHYCHGDIKNDNVIVNFNCNRMHLIDLGRASNNPLADEPYGLTPQWSEGYQSVPTYITDVYAMGRIVEALFSLNTQPVWPDDELAAIRALVNYMCHAEPNRRCTSGQALDFCRGLVAMRRGELINPDHLKTATHHYLSPQQQLDKLIQQYLIAPVETPETVMRGKSVL